MTKRMARKSGTSTSSPRVVPFLAALAQRYRARSGGAGREMPPPRGWTLLAAWGPCGLSPVAPGTVGTLGAVPLAWLVARLAPLPAAAFLAAFLALSVHAAGHAGRHWGVVDASQIVIDEVMGYLVTMAFVPFTWPAAAAGFALFRLCDVLKPWPASALDRLKSGLGVVLDDVAAGVWAGGALWLLARLAPGALS
jgi:phosphatidylglycerophosphatase A